MAVETELEENKLLNKVIICVFFAHKKCPYYLSGPYKCFSCVAIYAGFLESSWIHQTYLNLCSEDDIRASN